MEFTSHPKHFTVVSQNEIVHVPVFSCESGPRCPRHNKYYLLTVNEFHCVSFFNCISSVIFRIAAFAWVLILLTVTVKNILNCKKRLCCILSFYILLNFFVTTFRFHLPEVTIQFLQFYIISFCSIAEIAVLIFNGQLNCLLLYHLSAVIAAPKMQT